MKTAYFDCFSGASGDMILGALLDAGMRADALMKALRTLPADGWSLETRLEKRQGIAGTRVEVSPGEGEETSSRRLSDILEMIRRSGLSAKAKARAEAAFKRLAEAEAKAHGVSAQDAHFHEVGALDAVVDVVGAVVSLESLRVERVVSSPLPMGRGFIRCSHGRMPNPAPGTAELLRGVPVTPTEIDLELVTPTGAAILTTLAESFGPPPAMLVETIGYGVGKRDLKEQPNLLRVFLGESNASERSAADDLTYDRVAALETNIDDQSPEALGYLLERLMSDGALDVSFAPIVMKKSRPAHRLTAIVRPSDADRLTRLILRESTTLGVRMSELSRATLPRRTVAAETPYGSARAVVAEGAGVRKVSPEYEDCRRLAESAGIPLSEAYRAVAQAAQAALESQKDADESGEKEDSE